MATLTTITNPFDPLNNRETIVIDAGIPIYKAIIGFYCYYDVVVSINGSITEDFEYIVQEEDFIAFVAVPQGGGEGKNVWRTIAQIAVIVVAAYVGGTYGAVYGAIVMIGGNMLIDKFLPLPIPDFNNPNYSGLAGSASYSWSTTTNMNREGVVLPVVFGKLRTVPPIISQYIETVGDKQYLNLLYALNDGEIAGVSDIFINNNPISYYSGVTYDVRLGTNTQTLIPSFDNTRVDIGVSAKLSTTATVRQTLNNAVQALNIIVTAPSGLYHANDLGGLDARTVGLEVRYRPVGGIWVDITSPSISGATNSTVRATFAVNDLAPAQYEISVRRLVAEDTSVRTKETVFFDAFTEIIYDDFTYPNTALLAIRALATDQLNNSVPSVSCVVDRGFGLDNPALATKNIIQNMGASVVASAFTDWATWCTLQNLKCNIVFDSEVVVRDALNMISLLGRANVIQIGSDYLPVVDKEESLATQRFLFNMGNIVTDSFTESYLPLADRTNLVSVTYFDELLDYTRQTIEVSQCGFDENTDTTRKANITMYGCTNRTQAIRYARFLLNKNRYLTNTLTFEADVDAIACTIGDIIDVAHDVPQWGYSGRVTGITTVIPSEWVGSLVVSGVFEVGVFEVGVFETDVNQYQYVVLDREVTLQANVLYHTTIKYNDTDERETITVLSTNTITTNTLPLIATRTITKDMLYSFGEVDRTSKLFRIVAITRSGDQRRKISAIEYIPEVYNDTTDTIGVVNYSALSQVSSLLGTSFYLTDINGVSMNVVDLSWIGNGIGWTVYKRILGASTWEYVGYSTTASYRDANVKSGIYEYKVGDKVVVVTVDTLPLAPSIMNAVAYPRYTGIQFDITYMLFPGFSHVEVYEAALLQDINDAVFIGTTTSNLYQRYGLAIVDSRKYWFKLVDVYGNSGLFYGPVVGSTSTDVSAILADLWLQQGTPQYLPALSDILIAGYVSGVQSLGISGNLFVDGTVTANKLAVMGLSTFTNDVGFTDDTVANAALALASGKATTFYQISPPTALAEGDLWFDTDDNYKLYRWSGLAWVLSTQDAATAINNGATTINGSQLTTGTVTASQIAANTITASNIATGTITADKMNVTTLSAISANLGTITAGSVTADVITAGTLNVARLPGITIQNSIHTTSAVGIAENSATQASWPVSATTATPTVYTSVASRSHVKSSTSPVKVNYYALLQNNGGGAGTTGTGWLWVKISRDATVLFNQPVGWAGAFVMGGSAPVTTVVATPLNGFFIDTTTTTGTFTYTLEMAICCQISNQNDVYVPYSVDFETFQTVV